MNRRVDKKGGIAFEIWDSMLESVFFFTVFLVAKERVALVLPLDCLFLKICLAMFQNEVKIYTKVVVNA